MGGLPLDQLTNMALGMEGKRLKYVDLIARAPINRNTSTNVDTHVCILHSHGRRRSPFLTYNMER